MRSRVVSEGEKIFAVRTASASLRRLPRELENLGHSGRNRLTDCIARRTIVSPDLILRRSHYHICL